MTRLMPYIALAAGLVVPPLVAGALGMREFVERERPPLLPPMSAERLAAEPRPAIDAARPTVVVLLGADLTEITDALGPYEMFARAGRWNVVTAAPERRPTLLTGGLRILPHYALAELDARLGGRAPAIVLVPNIPNVARPQNAVLVAWLQRQAAGGALVHSWCKGAMALAHAGLLDGMTATAHWGDLSRLEKRYPKVTWVRGVRWVDHGQLAMSAGITSGVDASLHLLARLAGDSVARRVAREIRYPDHRYVHDPAAEQYRLRPADAIVLANAAFRAGRARIGVALYDGVTELDLGHVYDAHAYTAVADVETVAADTGAVRSAHGLTLLPSLAAGEDDRRLRGLDRLVVPGPDARTRGATLAATIAAAAPALRAEYLHADDAARYGLEPVLEDLARTADLPTARFALRRLEYRSAGVRLAGDAIAWRALAVASALSALGALAALALLRLTSRPRMMAAAVAVATAVALPTPARAQALDGLAAGTRIRADVHTTDASRLRRVFAQPVAGELVAVAGDTLVLSVHAGSDPLRIPRSALREVYVSRGRANRIESALRRAAVPAIAGGALRGLAASMRREEGDPSPGRAALTGAATSAAFAGAMGLLFPRERWRRVGR